jgi:hypothetical protein
MATTKVTSTTTKSAPNAMGSNASINWLETSAAGANVYAVQDTATKAKILLRGTGDTVMIEGFSSEYQIRAVGRTVTLRSDTQTVVLILNNAVKTAATAVTDTLVFLDGSVELGNIKGTPNMRLGNAGVVGEQKINNKFVDILTAIKDTNTDASDYFSGSTSGGSSSTPTYAIASAAASVDEGGVATFNVTTTNVAAGTLAYTLTGTATSGADYTAPGVLTIGADGKGTLAVQTTADNTTEAGAAETLILNIGGTTGTISITDTSLTPSGGSSTASKALTSADNNLTVADGGSTVNTTYTVASGTYTATISGFGAGDKLSFFAGASTQVLPDTSDADGIQSIQASDAATGTTTTITLTGLTTEQDTALFNIPSMGTVFGAGTIV